MIIVAFGCVMMGAIIHYLLALTRHVSNFIHINIIFMHILISLPFPLSFTKKTEPWLHVTYFFLGGYIGQRWVRLEKELVMDINEIRADKGMPPMVATNAMLGIKYQPSE